MATSATSRQEFTMRREERRWAQINLWYIFTELLLVAFAIRGCYKNVVLHSVSGPRWTAIFCPILFGIIWAGTSRLHKLMLVQMSDTDLKAKEKIFDQFADLNLFIIFMPFVLFACS
jgi:hypothetical protein